MTVFKHSLPESLYVWAAYTRGFFGLLRSDEFTLPSLVSFFVSLHLTVQDIAVDGVPAPFRTRIKIKLSKTGPFR